MEGMDAVNAAVVRGGGAPLEGYTGAVPKHKMGTVATVGIVAGLAAAAGYAVFKLYSYCKTRSKAQAEANKVQAEMALPATAYAVDANANLLLSQDLAKSNEHLVNVQARANELKAQELEMGKNAIANLPAMMKELFAAQVPEEHVTKGVKTPKVKHKRSITAPILPAASESVPAGI